MIPTVILTAKFLPYAATILLHEKKAYKVKRIVFWGPGGYRPGVISLLEVNSKLFLKTEPYFICL